MCVSVYMYRASSVKGLCPGVFIYVFFRVCCVLLRVMIVVLQLLTNPPEQRGVGL